MFAKIAEAVRFHRGARAKVAETSALLEHLDGALGREREAHRTAKADLRAVRVDLDSAKDRSFWLEAENRDLRTKLGLKPKGDPAAAPGQVRALTGIPEIDYPRV